MACSIPYFRIFYALREGVRKVLLNKIFTTWNAKPCQPQTKMLYQGPRVQSNRDLGLRASDINTVQLDFSHFGLAWRGAWPSNVPETINCIHVQPVLKDGGIVSVEYAREPIDYSAAWYHGWQGFRWLDDLLELEFVADRSGPSLVYMKALAW